MSMFACNLPYLEPFSVQSHLLSDQKVSGKPHPQNTHTHTHTHTHTYQECIDISPVAPIQHPQLD